MGYESIQPIDVSACADSKRSRKSGKMLNLELKHRCQGPNLR